jgi:two-component system, NarL family, sensor histidine kinase UhpB
MNDLDPSREQLLAEVADLQRQLAGLEAAETARKQAEESVRKSEERFRTFASHTYDWECWHDTENALIYSSPSCLRMTGYAADEFYSDLTGTLRKLIHPDDIPPVIEHSQIAISCPEPLHLEHRIIRRDGQVRWIEHFCHPVFDANGQLAGRRSSNRDITEQKIAQDLLQTAHRDLEQRVQERTRELTDTVEQLHKEIQERTRAEEALRKERRTLQHLLRSSDHDRQLISYEIHDGLAQYLAGAIMHFQAHDSCKDTRPEHAAKTFGVGMTMLQRAHAEARHLISGLRPPILDESGIVAAVAHLVNEPQHQGKTKIEFHSDVQFDRLDSILENAIYRIIQECLANARKHSGSEIIRIEMVQHNGRLRLDIRDWGKGFDINAPREGCFGLEGVQERARLLGGSVLLWSAPDEGTQVTAELPLP